MSERGVFGEDIGEQTGAPHLAQSRVIVDGSDRVLRA
jgi:hypothetical protein